MLFRFIGSGASPVAADLCVRPADGVVVKVQLSGFRVGARCTCPSGGLPTGWNRMVLVYDHVARACVVGGGLGLLWSAFLCVVKIVVVVISTMYDEWSLSSPGTL